MFCSSVNYPFLWMGIEVESHHSSSHWPVIHILMHKSSIISVPIWFIAFKISDGMPSIPGVFLFFRYLMALSTSVCTMVGSAFVFACCACSEFGAFCIAAAILSSDFSRFLLCYLCRFLFLYYHLEWLEVVAWPCGPNIKYFKKFLIFVAVCLLLQFTT